MKYGNWERVKVTVDSGAVLSVMPKHVASVYDVEETSLSRTNANFLAADDTVIKNHGQRRVNAVDDKWKQTSMHFQVADVSKTLASVRELDASGHITMMGNNSGYIKNIKSGKTILLYAEGGEYKFDLWVPAQKVDTCKINGVETQNSYEALEEDNDDEDAAVFIRQVLR